MPLRRQFKFQIQIQISAKTSGSEAGATLRRLKLLAVVLVLSNLVVGAFSVYLIRRADRDYSALIDQTVPVLYQVRTVGGAGGRVFRGLIAGLVADDPVKCAAAIAQVKESLARGQQLRAQLIQTDFLRENPELVRELVESGRGYDQVAADILPRVTPQNTAEDERDRLEELQVVNARYSAALEKISTELVERARVTSDAYTARSHNRSAMLLGLAGWPFLAAALIAIVTMVVVVVMLFVFRQAGPGDGP